MSSSSKHLDSAAVIGGLLRTSLGPAGRCKMVVNPTGDFHITRDGYTLMTQMDFKRHPIGRLLVGLAETQQMHAADGTTTVVVLAGSLCAAAARLLRLGVHRWAVIEGFQRALNIALGALECAAVSASEESSIAAVGVALGTSIAAADRTRFAEVCWDAQRAAGSGGQVHVRRWSGPGAATVTLVPGTVLTTHIHLQPAPAALHTTMDCGTQQVQLAVLSCALEVALPKTKLSIELSSSQQLSQFEATVQAQRQAVVDRVIACGARVVVCQWAVDGMISDMLKREGILLLPWVAGDDLERVAMAVAAPITPRLELLRRASCGSASKVQIVSLEDGETGVIIEASASSVRTVLIQGGEATEATRLEQGMGDGIGCASSALSDPRLVAGGGCAEALMATAVFNEAKACQGVASLVLEEFSEALMVMPGTLAENAGAQKEDLVERLLRAHAATPAGCTTGVAKDGQLQDMLDAAIWDSYQAKVAALTTALEMASAIAKIDDIVVSKLLENKA